MSNIDLGRLKITNRLLVAEAQRRNWGVEIVDYRVGLVSYDIPGKGKRLFKGVLGPQTRVSDVIVADDKLVAGQFAGKAGLITPRSQLYADDAAAADFLTKNKTIVVKPIDSAHGYGVSVDVEDTGKLKSAVARAAEHSDGILLQQQVSGTNLRILILDGELLAAAIRKPAEVTGDGRQTIAELIKLENSSSRRAPDYLKPLNLIDEAAASFFLGDRLQQIPAKGQVVQVVGTANIGTGGYSIDVTDKIDKRVVNQAAALVGLIGMKISGVDFIWDRSSNTYYFIELNAAPSFGLHVYPAIGQSRPLPVTFLNWVEANLE